MVENVEQIEAKLAAYIDDALTPDERVELELHLEANPTHRAMIRELMGQRDMLRALPREMAPEGWLEPLESQFERDALLGGGDPLTEFKAVRARRWWPQMLAQAAIILLAFGLGTIVYFVLPPKHPTVAVVQPPEQPEGEARAEWERAAQDQGARKVVEVALADASGRLERKRDMAESGVVGAEPEVLRVEAGTAGDRAEARTEVDTNVAAPAVQDTLFITITADNVQQASSELRSYFAVNGIAWSESGQPEAVAMLTEAMGVDEALVTNVVRDSAVSGREAPPEQQGRFDRDRNEGDVRTGTAADETVARDTVVATPVPRGAARRAAVRSETASVPPPPAPTATASASASVRETEIQPDVKSMAPAAADAAGTERYVVLAALDGSQAERLADALSKPDGRRRAEVRRQAVQPEAAKLLALSKARASEQLVRPRVARPVQVGLAPRNEVAPQPLEGEFSLFRPTTKPVEVTSLWALNDDAGGIISTIDSALGPPATQPAQPFAFRVSGGGGGGGGGADAGMLDAATFNCVVVLKKPEAGAARAPQPVAAPATTRPVGAN